MPANVPDPTHERILNAAECLFAQHGFDGATMRQITEKAGVNLAAINYHFDTKEKLYAETFVRIIRPLNEQRLALLAQAGEAAGGRPVPLRAILESFIRPTFMLASGRPQFLALMSRNFSSPPPFMREVMAREFSGLSQHYLKALHATLPQLPPVELFWRMFYAIGALLFTTAHQETIALLSHGVVTAPDPEESIRRLVDFAAAGLAMPAAPA
jgi:AcrR family transcriptional regulator